jgi:hypothetical protein
MSDDAVQVLLAILMASVALGLYYLYEWATRKLLGLDGCQIPLPGPIRWTILLGAIISAPCIVFVGSRLF